MCYSQVIDRGEVHKRPTKNAPMHLETLNLVSTSSEFSVLSVSDTLVNLFPSTKYWARKSPVPVMIQVDTILLV